MLNDLPEDLIVEIFSRLPAKSLLRLRSLSKYLHACIGSPTLIRLHTLRSPKNLTIIHRMCSCKGEPSVYTSHSESKLSYNPYINVTPIKYPFNSFTIVGSCNGILCVYEFGKAINLWNPSIRRKVTLPGLSIPITRSVLGFGFDPNIDDYKILRSSRETSFVYTLKTGTWRRIASPTTPFSEGDSCQCLFNGALHWLVKWYLTDTLDVCHYYILKFDLSSEVFSTIELPEPSLKADQVTVIKDCLAVISSKDNRTRIWVRKECNNAASWLLHWSYAFNWFINPFERVRKVFERPTNGDLVFKDDKGIQAYDTKDRRLSTIRMLDCSSLAVDMDLCVESLGLLDMGTSCDQGCKSPEKGEKCNL